MSQWTHVAGVIRLDEMRSLLSQGAPDDMVGIVERILGPMATYEASNADPAACRLPMGSEGSLQYEVHVSRTHNSLSWGEVTLWGDLRDYGGENKAELHRWWNDLLDAFSRELFIVRQAVLQVEVEYDETSPHHFDHQAHEARRDAELGIER